MNTFIDETPMLTMREWLALAVLALGAAGEIEFNPTQHPKTRAFYRALAAKCDAHAAVAQRLSEVF